MVAKKRTQTPKQMAQLRRQGLTIRQIANISGVSGARVHKILGKTGRPKRISCWRLAKRFRRGINTVLDILEQSGVKPIRSGFYQISDDEACKIFAKRCKVCDKLLENNRFTYCSKGCRREAEVCRKETTRLQNLKDNIAQEI